MGGKKKNFRAGNRDGERWEGRVKYPEGKQISLLLPDVGQQ